VTAASSRADSRRRPDASGNTWVRWSVSVTVTATDGSGASGVAVAPHDFVDGRIQSPDGQSPSGPPAWFRSPLGTASNPRVRSTLRRRLASVISFSRGRSRQRVGGPGSIRSISPRPAGRASVAPPGRKVRDLGGSHVNCKPRPTEGIWDWPSRPTATFNGWRRRRVPVAPRNSVVNREPCGLRKVEKVNDRRPVPRSRTIDGRPDDCRDGAFPVRAIQGGRRGSGITWWNGHVYSHFGSNGERRSRRFGCSSITSVPPAHRHVRHGDDRPRRFR